MDVMDRVDGVDTLDVGWSHQRLAICYDVILPAEEKAANE
jgi:hypothetical protein